MNYEFKPLDQSTLEFARLLHNEPSVLKMLGDPHVVTEEEQQAWFESLQNSFKSKRLVVFLEDVPMAIIRLDFIDHHNHSVCVGMDIHQDFRGKGHAKPIYKKLINELFSKSFNRLWLFVIEYNHVAKKLYKELGFSYEGSQMDAICRNGKFYDYDMYHLLRREWSLY